MRSLSPNRNPSAGGATRCHLRALRALFGLVAFFDGTAPRIRKSSADLPPLIAAVNHFGLNPRPAQVSSGFCGLRYFGGTGPLSPNPEPTFRKVLLPCNRLSFPSSDLIARRRSIILRARSGGLSQMKGSCPSGSRRASGFRGTEFIWCYCRAITSFRFDITAGITVTQFSALFRRSLPKLVCERANMTIVATASDDQRTGRVG